MKLHPLDLCADGLRKARADKRQGFGIEFMGDILSAVEALLEHAKSGLKFCSVCGRRANAATPTRTEAVMRPWDSEEKARMEARSLMRSNVRRAALERLVKAAGAVYCLPDDKRLPELLDALKQAREALELRS